MPLGACYLHLHQSKSLFRETKRICDKIKIKEYYMKLNENNCIIFSFQQVEKYIK